MGLFDSFSISASGLSAERLRLDVIANNLANVNTTRTPGGGPYKRRGAIFAERLRLAQESGGKQLYQGAGVQVQTITEDSGPPRMVHDVFAERLRLAQESGGKQLYQGTGVKVQTITEYSGPPRMVHDPAHPDADASGLVAYPNINLTNEMADMISATRAYEANATVLDAAKGMALKALEIGR